MTKSSPPPVERAFTLIELLVVIATIAILAAIAVPAFNSVLESAKATKDMSNLRQIGAATQMYMNDNNGVLPRLTTLTWMSQLDSEIPCLPNTSRAGAFSNHLLISALLRKSATQQRAVSYGINANILPGDRRQCPLTGFRSLSTFIVFAPAQASGATVSFSRPGHDECARCCTVCETLTATSSPGGVRHGRNTQQPHKN